MEYVTLAFSAGDLEFAFKNVVLGEMVVLDADEECSSEEAF